MVGAVPTVTETFKWNGSYTYFYLTGTIEVSGNIECASYGGAVPDPGGGANPGTSGAIKFVGTDDKTYTHTSGILPPLEIACTAGKELNCVTNNALNALYAAGFTMTTGNFTAPNGIMSIGAHTNSGRTMFNIKAGAGTFAPGTGEVIIQDTCDSYNAYYTKTLQFDSAISFHKLTLTGGNTNSNKGQTYAVVGAVVPTVINTFKWATIYNLSYLNSGTIEVSGDMVCDSLDGYGTTAITLNGTGDQTITQTAGDWPAGLWTNSNTGGVVLQATDVTLGGDLDIANNARWCMEGYNLTANAIDNTLGGTIYRHGAAPPSPDDPEHPALDESHLPPAGGDDVVLLTRNTATAFVGSMAAKRSLGRSGNILLRRRNRRLLG